MSYLAAAGTLVKCRLAYSAKYVDTSVCVYYSSYNGMCALD